MKLFAISDLHLSNKVNCDALEALPPHLEDWLILGGDIGETAEHLIFALSTLKARFKQLVWVPGNHDLWTLPSDQNILKGEDKYKRLVSICQEYGVLTPEDPYAVWKCDGQSYLLVPMFIFYDYSFRPDYIPVEEAVVWAAESGVICTDEDLLFTDPFDSRPAWCAKRYHYTESRLKDVSSEVPLILINHFPLRQEFARLKRFPRFSIWCGTRRTEDWHKLFNVAVVVYGHMHTRSSDFLDNVRFNEVSLGYPRDWDHEQGILPYLREILPGKKTSQV